MARVLFRLGVCALALIEFLGQVNPSTLQGVLDAWLKLRLLVEAAWAFIFKFALTCRLNCSFESVALMGSRTAILLRDENRVTFLLLTGLLAGLSLALVKGSILDYEVDWSHAFSCIWLRCLQQTLSGGGSFLEYWVASWVFNGPKMVGRVLGLVLWGTFAAD